MANLGPVAGQKTFDELVEDIAGQLLVRMIKGESWRSIVWSACNAGAQWKADHQSTKHDQSTRIYPKLTYRDIDDIVELFKNALRKEHGYR